jgi:hypothetical protein
MGVGQGENRKESEGFSAPRAAAATNPNPVVTLVMSLFAPSAMADDRIAQTLRTETNDLFDTSRRPVKVWVAIVSRKWDKQNRIAWRALSLKRTPPRISAQKRAFLPPARISMKTDIKDNPPFCVSAVRDWPVNCPVILSQRSETSFGSHPCRVVSVSYE